MTLQDDIEKALFEDMPIRGIDQSARADVIAAEIERDYYLVKLADLPEVEQDSHGQLWVSDAAYSASFTLDDARSLLRRFAALALHLEARESEAAVLARRRDELAQKFAPRFGDLKPNWYGNVSAGLQRAIDHIIETDSRATS